MKVSREFLKDFAEIANRYGWNADDIEEVKAHMREHFEPMRRYWSTLAAAHRAGYEQTKENGYIRLDRWRLEQGYPPLSFHSDTGEQP